MTNRLWVDLRINGFTPESVPESEKHHGIVMVPEADAAAAQAPYALPTHEDRPDGFRCLAFHRGKWRDVCWSVDHQRFSLGYGGAFILEGDRQFAQLPPIPADDAWGFYGDRS